MTDGEWLNSLYESLTEDGGVPSREVMVRESPNGARVRTTHKGKLRVQAILTDLGLTFNQHGSEYRPTFNVIRGEPDG